MVGREITPTEIGKHAKLIKSKFFVDLPFVKNIFIYI